MIYKHNKPVTCLYSSKDCTLFFFDKGCEIWGTDTRTLNLPHKALGVYIKSNIIYYYTDVNVFSTTFTGDIVKLCSKETLDCIIFLENIFYLVNDKHVVIYNYRGEMTHSVNLIHKGVCAKGVYEDVLYLAFEDGSICYIQKNKLTEIIKMDENITSFDVQNQMMCIAYFYKKIAICDTKGENFKYTEISFTPKIIKFWKEHITVLDEENNFFLLNQNLKILYCENYENKLSFFEVQKDKLFLVMKSGTVISTDNITEYI